MARCRASAALVALLAGACGGDDVATAPDAATEAGLDAGLDAGFDVAVEADGGGEAPSDAALDECEDDVVSLLIATKASMPLAGSGGYVQPSAAEQGALGSSIAALLAGDVLQARSEAALAGYSICRRELIALWRPIAAASGAASVAWRAGGARPVILEAPHPLHDSGTLEQAAGLFETLGARAIIASGTHRCANAEPSPCDGTTEACSSSPEPYRESDMAHVSQSFFHRAHSALADHYSQAIVIGVHGMKDGGASISDGTTQAIGADSIVARLAAALVDSFSGTPVAGEPVTTCNPYPGAPAVEERLCGTTDVQGRHLNASADACTQAAAAGSGRFVHLEQSAQVRDHAALVAAALDAVLPE